MKAGARRALRLPPGYSVGLVAALVFLPGFCTAAVVAWKLAGSASLGAAEVVAYGTLVGVAGWLLVALPLRRNAFAHSANPGVYQEHVARLEELRRLSASLEPPRDAEAWVMLQADLDSASRLLERGERGEDGLSWAMGTAYITLFTVIHRAEQALVELVPEPDAVRFALSERSSVTGSRIAESAELVARLDQAIAVLGGVEYLPDRHVTRRSGESSSDLARAVVRGIRTIVDDFRDSRRAGLVRARNALFTTIVATGLVAYAGLALVLLAGAGKTQIVAGTTFYLIGASVGLFRQLRQAAAADTITEEDFGLGLVRLAQIPLLSGLAAIGGVVLTSYLTALNEGGDVPPLTTVFDIGDSPVGLVSAAVFGFTPALLGATLQRRSEQWKEELKSSDPGERAPQ